MSCAKMGSNAVAEANSVAAKSSSMVERTIGCANTNRRPSRAAVQVIRVAGGVACLGGARLTSKAAVAMRKETAVTAFPQGVPGPAITRAARAGPAAGAHLD